MFPGGTALDPGSVLAPVFYLLTLVAAIMTAADAVFAYLDRQRLLRAGVTRPFPWAWAFLGGPVYVIGRITHLNGRTRATRSIKQNLQNVFLFVTLGAVQAGLIIVYMIRSVSFASGGTW
jgi:hypothetical protein